MTDKVQYIALGIGVVIGFVFLLEHSGGPISFDELLYMHASLTSQSFPEILNRYFHIYLQKFFFCLCGNPLLGAKVFWSFIVSTSVLLIYASSRILSPGSGFFVPLTAVMMFLSQRLIFHYSGVTYADFTQMLMMLIGFSIYTLSTRYHFKYRRSWLAVFGFILFLALKSNEIGAGLLFLLLGLVGGQHDRKERLHRMKDLALVAMGALLATLAISFLDHVFNHDFLFQFRVSNVRSLLFYNSQMKYKIPRSFFAVIFDSYLIIPFLFYLTLPPVDRRNHKDTISWSFPLIIILLLTLLISSGWVGTNPRYLIPAIPIMCIWASQFFASLSSNGRSGYHSRNEVRSDRPLSPTPGAVMELRLLTLFVLSVIIAIPFYKLMACFRHGVGWKGGNFYLSIILPACSISIITLRFLSPRCPVSRSLIIILFTIALYNPIGHNFKFLLNRNTARESEQRFLPFRTFQDKVAVRDDTRIFISKNIFDTYGMLGRDTASCTWMFNVYFNQKFPYESFECSFPLKEVLGKGYHYLFLISEDLKRMEELDREATKKYAIWRDHRGETVLLVLK